jgi:hypothetical protein
VFTSNNGKNRFINDIKRNKLLPSGLCRHLPGTREGWTPVGGARGRAVSFRVPRFAGRTGGQSGETGQNNPESGAAWPVERLAFGCTAPARADAEPIDNPYNGGN